MDVAVMNEQAKDTARYRDDRPPDVRIENWLYRLLGSEWCGNTHAPGDHLSVRLSEGRWYGAGPKLADVRDDGHVLWIWEGDDRPASLFIHQAQAVRLAWFILWRWWAVGTWFGLRRAAWYWLLSRSVNRAHRMRW